MSFVQHGDERVVRGPLMRAPGAAHGEGTAPAVAPRVLVFDSGLGGLTVLDAIVAARPDADLVFAADDAVFPYGRLSEADLVARVMSVIERLVETVAPDIVVIACHTASTLVLPPLRTRFAPIAIVGTVPAIKPAALLSQSRLVSVLATPGTVAREYTRALVDTFAGDCRVTLVGAARLAALAEAAMRGEAVEEAAIAGEIAPAFVTGERGRTDAVVLACTHYPLLLDRLQALAPWPVAWIDPAPAIARRVGQVAAERGWTASGLPPATAAIPAILTSGRMPGPALRAFLAGRGVAWIPNQPF
jgi:glutamate racemase